MSEVNDGGPAFPFGQVSEATGQIVNGYHNDGMTLRDYFAAKAILITEHHYVSGGYQAVARAAYRLADALLEARK